MFWTLEESPAARPAGREVRIAPLRLLWQDGIRSGSAGPLNIAELKAVARRARQAAPPAPPRP